MNTCTAATELLDKWKHGMMLYADHIHIDVNLHLYIFFSTSVHASKTTGITAVLHEMVRIRALSGVASEFSES